MDYYDAKNIHFFKSAEDFFISKRNTRIILMTTKSKKSYKEFLFKKNDTVLFGRESSGVPTSVHKKVSHRLTIPMMNKKRSLNLSSSVSIVVIVVGLRSSELSNWDPRTRYVAELSNAAVPETGIVVFPGFVSVVTTKHSVLTGVQNALKESLIKTWSW